VAALCWLEVFLVALGICRRPVQAAITTTGSIAGAYPPPPLPIGAETKITRLYGASERLNRGGWT
jgi:hypothetical protein